MREIIYLGVSLPKDKVYEEQNYQTGIFKDEVSKLIVNKTNINGDAVADLVHHGGDDRVISVYAYEHYAQWEKEFGMTLPPSAFGENITVTNMQETSVYIGDIYQIGDTVVQVTQGRYPCYKVNRRNNNEELLKRFIETGFTGFFFRVLEEGTIYRDSKITKLEENKNKISTHDIHRIFFHKEDNMEIVKRALEMEEFAEQWKVKLRTLI